MQSRDVDIYVDGLHFKRLLGKGTTGYVYFAQWNNKDCAVKKMIPGYPSQFKTEFTTLAMLTRLGAPNVVRFYEAREEPFKLILMEYLPKGSLSGYLQSSEPLTWQMRYTFMEDMTTAVNFLHGIGWLHRDIKTENALLTNDMHIKLCDFGFAITCENAKTTTKLMGTFPIIAPELHAGKHPTKACDIYSLGISYWEIASREEVFNEIESNSEVIELKQSGHPVQIPEDCPPPAAQLIEQCVQAEPEKRPTAGQALTAIQKGSWETLFATPIEPAGTEATPRGYKRSRASSDKDTLPPAKAQRTGQVS